MATGYNVKLETFEGPLELLLDLIEKRKLFINEISLAQIADDYIEELKKFESFPVNFVSNFLVVAATLVLVKSKSLLPTLSLTPEETQDIKELEDRLKEYQRIRELSLHIKYRFGKTPIFSQGMRRKEVVFTPTQEIQSLGLVSALRDVIARFPQKTALPKVLVKKVVSLEEVMDKLATRITSHMRMSFKEFAGVGKEEKVNVIVSFLAMLELVKQGVIAVTQHQIGEDIEIETNVVSTPAYGVGPTT